MGPRPRVLVVDDEPAISALLAEALADDGHEVVTASDGEEALRLVEERVPNVVLLDLKLPGMGGLEFLDHCRAQPACAGMAVIVVTAMALPPWAEWGEGRPEVRAVVAKPFDLFELLDLVRATVAGRLRPASTPAESPTANANAAEVSWASPGAAGSRG